MHREKHSLEIVEQTLMQRVDKKITENAELKNLVNDLRSQLDMKSDAINKA